MRDKQQTALVKFKRLVLHPAMVALCAADAAGYYVTQMRLNAPAPEAAVPAYASAAPSNHAPGYGPPDYAAANASAQDRPSVSFALPQELAPGPVPVVDPQSALDRQPATRDAAAAAPAARPLAASALPIAQLAVISGITPQRTLGAQSAPALHAAAKVASAPGKHAAAHAAAAAFDRAFPAHFAARHRAVTRRETYPEAAALQASSAERVVGLTGFEAPLPAAFDLRAKGVDTAELPPAELTASPANPLGDPAALTQPVQSGDFDAAGQPGLPLSQALPLSQTLAPAGGSGAASDPGPAAVRLSDLLRAFEPAMDRAEFVRLSNSPHTAALVTLDTLRSAGIPLHYDAAGTVFAPGGIEISTIRLG